MSARERLPTGVPARPSRFSAARTAKARPSRTSLTPTGWPRSSSATAAIGSGIDAASKDSAVVASIALQHVVPGDVIRNSLLRDSQRNASSPLGAALDAIAEQKGG